MTLKMYETFSCTRCGANVSLATNHGLPKEAQLCDACFWSRLNMPEPKTEKPKCPECGKPR
jgi:NMD protein affecting ribosome stability and mRNA decay